MNDPSQIPEGLTLDKPSAARIYDYLLGGFHNFEIDRLAAEQALKVLPDVRLTAQANRAFLRRVVNFLASTSSRRELTSFSTSAPAYRPPATFTR